VKIMRSVALFSALLLFVCPDQVTTGAAAAPAHFTQATQTVDILAPGAPIERELSSAETHSYRITLSSGAYLRVAVAQKGIDVSVKALGPDNNQVVEVNDEIGGGSEQVYLIADAPGDYHLKVSAARSAAPPGRYEIKIEDLRTATAQDRSLVAAVRVSAEGRRLRRQFTEESLRSAVTKYEEALRLYRAADEREREVDSLNSIGETYQMLGDHRRASELFLESLSIARSIDNRPRQITALINLGGAYQDLGEAEKSFEHLEQALELSLAAGALQAQASAHINIGVAYAKIDEPQKALEHFSRAMAIHQATGNNRAKSMTLTNLASAYSSLGEYEKALAGYQEVLTIVRAANYSRGIGVMLVNIGVVYLEMGAPRKALDVLNEALSLSRSAGDRASEAGALGGLGDAHYGLGEPREALERYSQKLIITRELGLRMDEATTLWQIGAVYALTGEGSNALEYLNQALSLSRSIKSRAIEASTLYHMACVERSLGRLAEARSLIEAALVITESQRAKVASQELRASYLASKRQFYEFYIDILMRLHGRHPLKGYRASAFEASEKARARSLLEMLAESRADVRQGVDPLLLARERQLQRSLNAKEQYRMRLLGGGPNEKQLAIVEKELAGLLSEYQQLQAQIRQRSPRYATLTQPQPLSAAEIQRQLLDDDTILIEYALGAERSYMWVVTKDDLTSFELPKRDMIEAAARRVYELLTARNHRPEEEPLEQRRSRIAKADADYAQSAAALSQMLLGPAATQLTQSGKKRLLIVSDGALQYIPFGVLPEPESGRTVEREARLQGYNETGRRNKSAIRNPRPSTRNPLIVTHEVVSLPSASTIAVLRQGAGSRQTSENLLAVLADPVFAANDPRVEARLAGQAGPGPSAPAQTVTTTAAVDRSARESGVNRFLRLRFTRIEAEAIASFAPEGSRFTALDFSASRAVVNQTDLSKFRFVHFATHGLLNSQHPELSGVVLSLVDEKGRPEDGFLRLHEIFNLKLNADLVVLSGCRTALGKQIRGEGLIGLTRGFMHAGAKSVMASLWNVDDQATANLMKLFYERMLKDGLRPSAAIRAAQVAMWKTEPNAVPYRWGAFILQGDWN
jgi:CHAT domain-containing protein